MTQIYEHFLLVCCATFPEDFAPPKLNVTKALLSACGSMQNNLLTEIFYFLKIFFYQ